MGIDAITELTGIERAQLSVLVTEAGFKVLQRLMEDQIKKFNLDLINSSKPDEIILKHNMAKAAAQFYQLLVNRINQEVLVYHQEGAADKPVDVTEGLMDMDFSAVMELPNLLESE